MRGEPEITAEPDQCSCGHVENWPGKAYNEEAFRYFVEIERKRSEISNRPFLLLLVDLKHRNGASLELEGSTAPRLFKQLSRCLRDTDFVGWYFEDRIAGAVLTQQREFAHADVCQRVAERVRRALTTQLEADISDRLQVRVYQVPPMPEWEMLTPEGHS